MRLYFCLQAANLRSRAVYLVNFVVGTASIALSGLSALLLLWVVMQRAPIINGWTFQQLVFMASIWRLCHGLFIVLFQQVWEIDSKIRQGSFDTYLARPAGLLFQYMTSKFQIAGLGELVTGVAGVVWSAPTLTDWSLPHLGWLIVTIISGVAIEWSIFLMAGATAFWTQKSEALRDIIGTFLFQFTNYPLTIYGPTIRFILTFVLPFGFMHFYPTHFFMPDRGGGSVLVFMAPAVAALTVTVGYTLWRFAIRAYQGAGS